MFGHCPPSQGLQGQLWPHCCSAAEPSRLPCCLIDEVVLPQFTKRGPTLPDTPVSYLRQVFQPKIPLWRPHTPSCSCVLSLDFCENPWFPTKCISNAFPHKACFPHRIWPLTCLSCLCIQFELPLWQWHSTCILLKSYRQLFFYWAHVLCNALIKVPHVEFFSVDPPSHPVSWLMFTPFIDKNARGLRDGIICAESWLVCGEAEISPIRAPILATMLQEWNLPPYIGGAEEILAKFESEN